MGEVGDFTVITEGSISGLPLKGQRPGESPHPLVSAFVGGYTRGFISNRVLTPAARELESQHDATLGSGGGSFPLVPLSGPVVEATIGLLEIYQVTLVFEDATAVQGWVDLRSGQLEGETTDAALPQARLFRYWYGEPSPEHEQVLRILIGRGAIMSDFSFQSSGQEPLSEALELAGPSLARISECAR